MRIIDFFDKGATNYPDNTAFVDAAGHCTYRDAARQTHAIANAITNNGFGIGSHVGILAPNCNTAFLSLLGVFRASAIWLPINPRNPTAVNADLLERFDGELLMYHSAYAAEAEDILSAVPGIRKAVCIDCESKIGASLSEWMAGGSEQFSPSDFKADDTAAIFPTGGTTGKPKGVVVTHRNIQTMFANFYAHFDYLDNTRHLVVAPMTHSAGVLACLHFARGGTNVIMPAVDPEGILRAIEGDRITHLFVPPTILYMLLAHPKVREYDYSSLQHFFIGAAPTSLEKLKQALDVFGLVMTECFGQTECPSIVTAKAPGDYLDDDGQIIESRLHSIGRPAVFNQVSIMDDAGNLMATGESGEIVVRGDLVTPEYYKDPKATTEVRQFGWHHTGDIGVMDGDGFIAIVDRKKDMIITGGFNVFPNEIEQVITTHASVQECAVIGVPDDKWGEAVKAVVLLKPGEQADEADLINLVKAELGSVKAPKSVDFVDDLPRSAAGKVLKTEIRKQYWEGRDRAVN